MYRIFRGGNTTNICTGFTWEIGRIRKGKVTEGFEYKWVQDGKTYRVRIHGIDESAPAGSNAANGWVVRVQKGKRYLDPVTMEYQPTGITNINSPNFNEELANRTHIPIQDPKE